MLLRLAFGWMFTLFTDYNIDAPPSLKPTKKYSDISGLPVSYHYTLVLFFHNKKQPPSLVLSTHWICSCFFAGKLHRPSDKVTLYVIWGVLLHPPSPHWCCYRLPGPSKGNLHCAMTADQALKNKFKKELNSCECRRLFGRPRVKLST